MAKKGFTGSDLYFQDKFNEFDFWSRYNRMRPKEGFEQMWKDIKNSDFIESFKMEEGEKGKLPPIPPTWLGLGWLMRGMRPVKGLYELEKKTGGLGVSMFKTIAGEGSRRTFLQNMIGNTKAWKDAQFKELLKKAAEKARKNPGFKFPGKAEIKKFMDKTLDKMEKHYHRHYKRADDQPGIGHNKPPESILKANGKSKLKYWDIKGKTKHAEGGIAGMLGEPRSGYQDGKEAKKKGPWYLWPYKRGQEWDKILEKLFKDKEINPEDYKINVADGGRIGLEGGGVGAGTDRWDLVKELYKKYKEKGGTKTLDEFGSDVLFQIDRQEGPYFREGGRIGLAEGDTPSEAWLRNWFYDGGWDDKGVITLDEFMHGPIGAREWDKHINKAQGGRIGYDNGGPVTQEEYDEYVAEKEGAGEEPMDFETYKLFKIEFPMAAGGRIGFKDGEGIMSRVGDMVDVRNVPYYSGKALQGLVNSAETLSKFPLAAGELGSKLIQQPPKKEMFMEAIEDITPGSWSENLGLTSLIEGMGEKRPDDAKTVGGILGLGTEIAVPTGGAFKAGQFLLNKASKLMGKVKDGKTLNKLVEDKISDSGQSRRDFMSLVGAGGLAAGLKWLGLGGILKTTAKLKPSDDVVIRLRTFIDDSDVDTEWGPVAQGQWAGAFDIESLSKAAAKTMEKLMFPGIKGNPRDRIGWSKHRSGHNEGITYDIPLDEGSYIVDTLKKAGHKVRFEHIPDAGGWSVDDILNKFKNDPMYKGTAEGAEKYKKFKEKTDKWSTRKKEEYHSDITDEYGQHHNPDVEDFFDTFYGVEKAEGGRIGLDTGGPPISGEELKQMKKESSGPGIMDFLKITGSGGMSSNRNIYDQGQQIPGLDQKQYNYGFDVNANIPFDLPGGGQLELQGGTGFGRGKTETTYKGESVPGMSGMGESKLGDQWNIGAKITYPFADGGLTKTIPPERGPDPQGLPSALYNGIMRPRSY